MKVIQFGFSDKGAHMHLPHRYTPDTVAYTGTHDNDTTQGWWNTANRETRSAVEALVGSIPADSLPSTAQLTREPVSRPVWPLIRAVEASVAALAIIPASDLLELDSTARMNTPSVGAGNWAWRIPQGALTPQIAARLAVIVEVTDRENDPIVTPNSTQ
jgi:4-alpha-glucanotransferase